MGVWCDPDGGDKIHHYDEANKDIVDYFHVMIPFTIEGTILSTMGIVKTDIWHDYSIFANINHFSENLAKN